MRAGPSRLSSRLVAATGRYVVVWLSLAIVAAAAHPLDTGGLAALSLAAVVWLANLRAAFASTPYVLGPWVPSLIGTGTGLVCVAALNGHLPGLDFTLTALFGAAFGVFVSIGVWEWLLERTLNRRRVLVVGSTDLAEVAAAARRGRGMAFEVLGEPAAGPRPRTTRWTGWRRS